MPHKELLIQHLKDDLQTLLKHWEILNQNEGCAHDPTFLKKVATDIQQLDQDAKKAATITELKESAQLVHFALTTPWGAPFIGETTLVDAANTYTEENNNSSLQHLLSDFARYGHEEQAPLLKVFDEIFEELGG